jgi:hypothetical protein
MSKREEMLEELHELDFRAFWPRAWVDIGFTEREIWVNSEGYGFYCIDEPNIEEQRDVIRDDCDVFWDDLSEEELNLWIERLHAGELESEI